MKMLLLLLLLLPELLLLAFGGAVGKVEVHVARRRFHHEVLLAVPFGSLEDQLVKALEILGPNNLANLGEEGRLC